MNENGQKLAIDSLRDWSKWLIGINFAASAGCTAVARTAHQCLLYRLLVAAVTAFSCSLVFSAILVYILATVVERLPITDPKTNQFQSIGEDVVWRQVKVKHVSRTQLGFFILGGLLFVCWVSVLHPAK